MADRDITRGQGEVMVLSLRFPKELYERIPVRKKPHSGAIGGRSEYLRRLLIRAVQNDLVARESTPTKIDENYEMLMASVRDMVDKEVAGLKVERDAALARANVAEGKLAAIPLDTLLSIVEDRMVDDDWFMFMVWVYLVQGEHQP